MRDESDVFSPQTSGDLDLPAAAGLQEPRFVERADQARERLASEADPCGWDMASVVRLSQVNAALKTGLYPASFAARADRDCTASGAFGPWTMSRGGSGSSVLLRIPLEAATMNAFDKILSIDNGSITIRVRLNYRPRPSEKDDPAGVPNDLIIGTDRRSAEEPAVVVQAIDYGNSDPPTDQQAQFSSIMGIWFNDNIELFNAVFAVVSLDQMAKAPQFSWLKPTSTSYAYYDGNRDVAGDDEAYFGVLSMTGGKAPTGLADRLPAAAIPYGMGAAFLIGNRLLLESIVLPAMPAAFPKATTADFSITKDRSAIRMNHDLGLEKVRVGALEYRPTATSMITQIVGDEIQTRVEVHIPIAPGIDAHVISESWYTLQLVTKPAGGQTIGWVATRPASRDSYFTKANFIVMTEMIYKLIDAVAAVVEVEVSRGVTRAIAAIAIGIVAGSPAATPSLIAMAIAEGAATALPPIDAMLKELTAPVEWPGTAGFTLAQVQLNGALQLSGGFRTGT